ncbi:methyltransferase [Alteromonas pelagimontana]|uniref:Methyltransferase n=1 Tax=Alteromonas pelagimontana TaxID=1858656 RepID=A0A6M4MGY5_9ALTE|nr:class I SAM-dependent methyltransferase [Alteromonas pelagimontana]QJR81845.1 methyltransferase [Alteromonas pelagimontana]
MEIRSLNDIAEYYDRKLLEHGDVPEGADWKSLTSQRLRFEQLVKVVKAEECFSVADLGCGYGALYDYLFERYENFIYHGYDISSKMLDSAVIRYGNKKNVKLAKSHVILEKSDYALASGIFNVIRGNDRNEWLDYILNTLDNMNSMSRHGFSFNCLTKYSDKEKMRADLYYTDPCALFDICKTRYSRNVVLFHDYDLYEFTIVVRKSI